MTLCMADESMPDISAENTQAPFRCPGKPYKQRTERYGAHICFWNDNHQFFAGQATNIL